MARRPASQPTTVRRAVPSGGGATSAWISTRSGRVPSTPAKTAEPEVRGARARRGRGRRGSATSARPRAGHLEDADLVGGAEAVLDGAQDAELVAALALEVEHGVDHVLDDARAGDLAVLGDVADEDDRGAAALGEGDELVGGGADLGDRARRAVDVVGPHGLDRVDDGERRALGLERGQDVAEVGLGGEPERRVGEAEARGAQADLGGGLLAGDVDGGRAAGGEGGGGLQQQRRLADAGIAADEDGRGRDEAAAEDAVELGDAGEGARRAAARRAARSPRVMRRPRAGPRLRPAGPSARPAASSAMEFQAPQASQRPDHLAWVAPQAVQAKAGRRVLMRRAGVQRAALHACNGW